jgi:hypothetical protein
MAIGPFPGTKLAWGKLCTKPPVRKRINQASWQTAGGVGAIAEYNGLIVVNHNARVHAQVEQLLEMLRQAAASGDKPAIIGDKE